VVLGALFGVVPGCLGAFTIVSLYSHRSVSFGALVAGMVATSGDEAFVMFSLFPLQALWISLTLFITALAAGWLADALFRNQARFLEREDHDLELHAEETCHCFSISGIAAQLKQITFARTILIPFSAVFCFYSHPVFWVLETGTGKRSLALDRKPFSTSTNSPSRCEFSMNP